ncbi:hypothetical protein [Ciceribacter sp. L1K22]|uniref:hypothetical protein n=1 Tax=Ciceribacter sp. L1K22 TaxID=2820275 RepID=UPI001ABE4020|nr:hypothetical protein [Ciceribacter sp. L1K22]MBO3760377.1 hypothetical protein [Ciceribacter sp. L1K22]
MNRASSVDGLVKEAEDRKVRTRVAEARAEVLPRHELLDGLQVLIRAKVWWIENFSVGTRRRPDHEVSARRRELAVLVQASDLIAGRPEGGGQGDAAGP